MAPFRKITKDLQGREVDILNAYTSIEELKPQYTAMRNTDDEDAEGETKCEKFLARTCTIQEQPGAKPSQQI